LVRLKLDPEVMGLSLLLERLAKVRVKDCFLDGDTVYYVVATGQVGKALGKGAINIKKLSQKINKKIKVIEYRDNPIDFVKKVIYPAVVTEVIEEERVIVLKDTNKKTKSLLIGRGGKNLKLINRAVQRFFNKEIKVE